MARRDAEDANRSDSLSVADLLRAAGREDILTNRRRRRGDEALGTEPVPPPGPPEQSAIPRPIPVAADVERSSAREAKVTLADIAAPATDISLSEQPDRSQGRAPVAQVAQLARTEALAKLADREPSWFTLAEFSQPIRPAEAASSPQISTPAQNDDRIEDGRGTPLPLAVVKAAVESADLIRPVEVTRPVEVADQLGSRAGRSAAAVATGTVGVAPVPTTALPLAAVKAAVETANLVRPQPRASAADSHTSDRAVRTAQAAVTSPLGNPHPSADAEPDELADDPDTPTHGVLVQWLLVLGELVLAVGLGVALSYVFRLLWDVAPYVAAVSAPVAVCALVGNVGWVRKRLGLGALPLWLLLVILFVAMLLVVLPAAWILTGQ